MMTRDDKEELAKEWRRSDLTQDEFCAEKGISITTLHYWLYGRKGRGRKKLLRFLPVEMVKSPAPTARRGEPDGVVELALATGVQLRFRVGTDTEYLAQLVRAVG